MDCAIKSTSVTFIRAAATLIQTRHICQICALWKFLSGFSIFCNYVQSDAIKSHGFQFSDPISVLQHESAKSVFQFSSPFLAISGNKKKLNEGATCAGLGSLGCISNNDVQFLFQSRHRHRVLSTRAWQVAGVKCDHLKSENVRTTFLLRCG